LRGADRADAALGEQVRRHGGDNLVECLVDLIDLCGEQLDPSCDPAQRIGYAIRSASQSGHGQHQPSLWDTIKPRAQSGWRRHDRCVQLVERGRARPGSAAPLE